MSLAMERPAGKPPARKRRPRPPADFKPRARAFVIDQVAGFMAFGYGCLFGGVSAVFGLDAEAVGMITLFLGFIGWFCYHWLTVANWGQTAGKEMLGVKVVRLDGKRVGRYHALGRVVAGGLSWATLGLGFLVPLFRKDRRALHDLVARTKVVSVAPPVRTRPPAP